ncbi:MAG: hypothetical protein LH616_10115 [Ilumatobacteraceae bacterium]|nr:hypothetical protein [Ilumatobacteraceae bacterium]
MLLAVAAVWAAVIIPPLLRSRVENRPNSSVTDFRRQLSTLQRAVPTRTMVPMRSMARPLAQAPQQRQLVHGQHGQMRRSPAMNSASMSLNGSMTGGAQPRSHGGAQADNTAGHRQMHLHKVSQREIVRRRRANVLFILVVTVGITGFLAATTHANAMVYAFALSFVSLCGYCYKLVQLRNYEMDRSYGEQTWFNAA